MKNLKFLISFLLINSINFSIFGDEHISEEIKYRYIGRSIKYYLENFHYRQLKINDGISLRAFYLYLDKLDKERFFLTEKNVQFLEPFILDFDDQLNSGKMIIADHLQNILSKNITILLEYQKEFFQKKSLFDEDEFLEVNSEKRSFAKNIEVLKQEWGKYLKYKVMNIYLSLSLHAKNSLTAAEIMAKARTQVNQDERVGLMGNLSWTSEYYRAQFISSIVATFDPHSSYLPDETMQKWNIQNEDAFVGVGMNIVLKNNECVVYDVVHGGAAWKEGTIEAGDVLLTSKDSMDGLPKECFNLDRPEISRFLKGKLDKEHFLTLRNKNGKIFTVTLKRGVVPMDSFFAKSSILTHRNFQKKIGYISLPSFYRTEKDTAGQHVREEVSALMEQGVGGIILDLRGNRGGDIQSSIDIAGIFIKEGQPVGIARGFGDDWVILRNKVRPVKYDGHLIVLVNGFSSSASEIVAGVLQDYKRALVVGTSRTDGKASMQGMIEIKDNYIFPWQVPYRATAGSLLLTSHKLYRVTGDSIQRKGVVPDILLSMLPFSSSETRESDKPYALEWDRVEGVPFEASNDTLSYEPSHLILKISQRLHKNKVMQVQYDRFKERDEDTFIHLTLSKEEENYLKEKEVAELLEKYKDTDPLQVSFYEPSLKRHKVVLDPVKWDEYFKIKRFKWFQKLQDDVILKEAGFILNDIIVMEGSSSGS